MKRGTRKRGLLSAPLFTPHGFVLMALAIGLIFAIAHLSGLRQYTSVISLTHDESISLQRAGIYCGIYLAGYMALALVAPVFLLAAAIFALLLRLCGRRSQTSLAA